MTADPEKPESKQPSAATSHAAASPDAPTDGAPTPFYDHLMSMIDATAEENGRAWGDGVDAALRPAGHGWRVTYPMACAAGFLVTLAAGGIIAASQMSGKEPPLVAGAGAPEAGSRMVVRTTSADVPVESPLRAAGPDGPEPGGTDGKQTGDPGIVTGSVPAGASEDPPAGIPVTAPIEGRAPDMEVRRAGLPDRLASSGGMDMGPSPPAAEASPKQPQQPDTPWSLTLAPASETDSAADPANPSPAGRIARVISHVNMRIGPSNSQAVVATIPGGSAVEVIDCQQWCEVIFTGRRGWVYRSFLGTAADTGAR